MLAASASNLYAFKTAITTVGVVHTGLYVAFDSIIHFSRLLFLIIVTFSGINYTLFLT